ncbi:MAG TPA: hypothetical protein VGB85_01755 [Nannocystis sp.]|jgi:hypothetical protein
MFKPFLLPLLCSFLSLLPACQNSEDIEARSAELTANPGLRVTISNAGELPPETVHAIAKQIEGNGEGNGAATVRVKKEDDASPVLEIELWGGAMPDAGTVSDKLKTTFPALASATIVTATIPAGQPPPLPIVAVDDDLAPADAEQQIRDQLAADGVDGTVNVKVEDGPEGRRVEINVKKTETTP